MRLQLLDELFLCVDHLSQLIHSRVLLAVTGYCHRIHHLQLPLQLLDGLGVGLVVLLGSGHFLAQLCLLALIINDFPGRLRRTRVRPVVLVHLNSHFRH